nr:hypothetical protein [Tanacetum cinerariifolium]
GPNAARARVALCGGRASGWPPSYAGMVPARAAARLPAATSYGSTQLGGAHRLREYAGFPRGWAPARRTKLGQFARYATARARRLVGTCQRGRRLSADA